MDKKSEQKKMLLVLLLAIGASIYAAIDMIYQIQADISPRITSILLFVYAVSIVVALVLTLMKKA